MRKLRSMWKRMAGLLNFGAGDADFSAELESHVAMHVDDGIRGGLDAAEARRQAVLRLGGIEQTRQAFRERARLTWLEDLLRDFLYGSRALIRQTAPTAVAVFTLAIGIGASTAIFSAIKPILISPLPYPHANRLMMVSETGSHGSAGPVTFGTFHGVNVQNRSFDALAVFKGWQPAISPTSAADRPARLDGQRVSADYFRTLGVAPLRGRDFNAADDKFRGPNVVVLSDKVWHERFAADAAIVGKQVKLDDTLYTVVGVMPSDFENVLRSEER